MSPISNKGFLLTLAVTLTASCMHGPTQACSPSDPKSRIIVKFVNPSRSAPENVQARTADGKVATLHHERAMSGETDVYSACAAGNKLAAIIHTLNQRSDIEYAEADPKLGFDPRLQVH